MIRFRGVGASRGIAVGPAHLTEVPVSITERRILRHDREAEVARLESAVDDAQKQLDRLHAQLDAAPGSAGHDLIDLHRVILRSPELDGEAQRLINEECFAAEWAVTRALERIRSVFARLNDAYFRDRGGDFEAVGDRLLRVLLGLPELRPEDNARGAIAVGVDMSPLDLFALQRAGIGAMVSESGGATSHAAIVARAFGLPYVVGVRHIAGRIRPGTTLIVDGTRGEVVVDPDDDALRVYRAGRELNVIASDSARPRAACLPSPPMASRSTWPPTSSRWRACRPRWRRGRNPSACFAPSSSTWSAPTCRASRSSIRTPSPRCARPGDCL